MTLYFKHGTNNKLWLLWCDQLKLGDGNYLVLHCGARELGETQ